MSKNSSKVSKTRKTLKKRKTIATFLSDNLLFVSMYSFVFIVLITISLNVEPTTLYQAKAVHNLPSPEVVLAAEDTTTLEIPRLKPVYNLSFPFLSSQGALAIDIDSNMPLFEKDPNLLLLPASTVKIVTALVALDYYKLDDIITVSDLHIEGQKIGLFEGEKITAGNLIEALLIFSANDAAEVLASNYPGGREVFISQMNEKVQEIGLKNTNFVNPSGIDEEGQVTTAYDLVTIATYAMNDPQFARIVGKEFVEISNIEGNVVYKLHNTNKLLGTVEGVIGVKTGWTEFARENLVTYIKRGNRKIMIALLGSQDRFGETKELIDWIYKNYEWASKEVAHVN